MKPLFLKYFEKPDSSSNQERLNVIIGDRRQTVDRIIKKAIEEIFDETPEKVEDDNFRLKSRESDIKIKESKLLSNKEFQELRKNHFTVKVNENVTEDSCGVSYSYHPD